MNTKTNKQSVESLERLEKVLELELNNISPIYGSYKDSEYYNTLYYFLNQIEEEIKYIQEGE